MRLSVGKLREIYRESKVRRKFLKETKLVTRPHLRKINAAAKEAHVLLSDHLARGFSIVYLDEVCFTKTTLPKLAWSAVRHNFQVDPKQYDTSCYAVVAAISYCRGLELVQIEKGSIDRAKFKVFLEDLRQTHWADDIAIFMDNLSVHRSGDVRERLEELGMPAIFNAAYSCENNPIEQVFSVVKHYFKLARLRTIQLGQKENVPAAITAAFAKVNVCEIRKMIKRS